MAKPIWYREAEKWIGLKEIRGRRHAPEILAFFRKLGHGWVKEDETPWCAAFVGAVLEASGYRSTRMLNARSYLEWGKPVTGRPQVGDVVVFRRGRSSWQGHVGFYAGETRTHIRVLGGNQSNAVNIRAYPKSKLLGVRRPRTIGQSRTLKAAGLGGVGTAATGAGAALGAVSGGASEAGYLLQSLGGMSQWFVIAGIMLMFVSIGLTVWARLDDFRNDEGRAMGRV